MNILKPSILTSPILLLALVAGCDGPTRTEQLEFSEAISHIDVDTGAGDIVVVAESGREQIDVEAVIYGDRTRLRWSVEDGTLHLDHSCAAGIGACSVDWYVWVPLAATDELDLYLDLDLESGTGDIAVDELRGNLRASTGSGNVAVRDVIGFALDLDTGSGDVSLARCEADDIEAHAGSGNVDVSLSAKPRRVALGTGSGDVHLSVPAGDYQLNLDTGSGDIDVHGVVSDSDADSRLSLETGSGNIVVHGS
jgi:hypothetical protein